LLQVDYTCHSAAASDCLCMFDEVTPRDASGLTAEDQQLAVPHLRQRPRLYAALQLVKGRLRWDSLWTRPRPQCVREIAHPLLPLHIAYRTAWSASAANGPSRLVRQTHVALLWES
jgi:hypothetical protein